jgi:hypothetical protein
LLTALIQLAYDSARVETGCGVLFESPSLEVMHQGSGGSDEPALRLDAVLIDQKLGVGEDLGGALELAEELGFVE